MAEPQHRRACDRCHAQKLRCNRQGHKSCSRCAKANVECLSSPSLRKGKARVQSQGDCQQLAPRDASSNHAPIPDELDTSRQGEEQLLELDQRWRLPGLNTMRECSAFLFVPLSNLVVYQTPRNLAKISPKTANTNKIYRLWISVGLGDNRLVSRPIHKI